MHSSGHGDEEGSPNQYNARILKFDSNFNLEWNNRVGGPSTDIGVDVVVHNNNYNMTGQFMSQSLGSETRKSSDYTGFIATFDKDGNKLWEHLSPNTQNNIYNDVIISEDEKIIIANTYVDENSNSRLAIKEYDLDGNYLLSKEIDNFEDFNTNRLIKSNYGGYILSAELNNPKDVEGFGSTLESVTYINKFDKDFNSEYIIPLQKEQRNRVTNIIELGKDRYLIGEQKFDIINSYYRNNNIDISIVEPKKYDITSNIMNGSITVNNKAIEGETVNFSLLPNEGYELTNLSVKDKNNNDITVSNNSFIMPNGNVTINVSFKKKIYTIKTEIVVSEVIDNNEITVEYGDNKIPNINPKYGYKLKKVFINDVDYTNQIVDNKININNINENINVKIDYEKITYISTNIKYTLKSNSDALIELNIDKDIDEVYINNTLLNKDNYEYEIKDNKLYLKLKNNYLDKLENDTYSIKIITDDGGEANSILEVIKEEKVNDDKVNTDVIDIPKILDNILFSTTVFIVSILGIIIFKKNITK